MRRYRVRARVMGVHHLESRLVLIATCWVLVLGVVGGCGGVLSEGPLAEGDTFVEAEFITCPNPKFDEEGVVLAQTWVENDGRYGTVILEGVDLASDEVRLLGAYIVRRDEERIWGVVRVPPTPEGDDGDSVELWEAREPLEGAELAKGEGAIIAVVVAPGEPDPGHSGWYDLRYRIGSRSYSWRKHEGITFDSAQC